MAQFDEIEQGKMLNPMRVAVGRKKVELVQLVLHVKTWLMKPLHFLDVL